MTPSFGGVNFFTLLRIQSRNYLPAIIIYE